MPKTANSTRITVELDEDTYLRIRILCASKKLSMSAYAAHLLKERIAASDVGDLVRHALKKKGESK